MNRKIILVTGGQRSGKSMFAEKMAKSLSENPVYVATAHVEDEEFRERVRIHQERRGPEWTTLEEEKYLSRLDVRDKVVLIDCCTLWLANFFSQATDGPSPFTQIVEEFDRLTTQAATFIFVTNEIGLGGTSACEVQRRFADCLGALNQHMAARADEVYLVISGIPLRIKG